mgnify:FL=1
MSTPPEQETPNLVAPVQVRGGAVYAAAALLWMGIVFISYFYINFHWVWDKVVEVWGWLFR